MKSLKSVLYCLKPIPPDFQRSGLSRHPHAKYSSSSHFLRSHVLSLLTQSLFCTFCVMNCVFLLPKSNIVHAKNGRHCYLLCKRAFLFWKYKGSFYFKAWSCFFVFFVAKLARWRTGNRTTCCRGMDVRRRNKGGDVNILIDQWTFYFICVKATETNVCGASPLL